MTKGNITPLKNVEKFDFIIFFLNCLIYIMSGIVAAFLKSEDWQHAFKTVLVHFETNETHWKAEPVSFLCDFITSTLKNFIL